MTTTAQHAALVSAAAIASAWPAHAPHRRVRLQHLDAIAYAAALLAERECTQGFRWEWTRSTWQDTCAELAELIAMRPADLPIWPREFDEILDRCTAPAAEVTP